MAAALVWFDAELATRSWFEPDLDVRGWFDREVIRGAPAFANLSASTSATGTSLTLSMPSSISAGDILIAVTTIASSRAPVWPAGWAAIGAGFAAYRVATGSDTAPTVTWTGSSTQAGWIGRWTGAQGGVGSTKDNQLQTTSPATVSAITTMADNSLCVALVISGSLSNTIPSLPSGFAGETTAIGSNAPIRFAEVQVSAAGSSSGAVSSIVDSAAVWRALLVELRNVLPVTGRRTSSQIGTRAGSRQAMAG